MWIERRVPRHRAARPPAPASSRPSDQATAADDDLGADVARADIDTRTDGHAARAARELPRRRRSTPGSRPVSRPSSTELSMHGAPDMIAAVITADGTWAGAAGIDGPKGRKAEPTDEFGIAASARSSWRRWSSSSRIRGRSSSTHRLSGYLEGVEVDANDATVRQALAMRSGIGGTPDGVIDKALAECDRPWSTEDVLGTVPAPFAAAGTQVRVLESHLQAGRGRGRAGVRQEARRRAPHPRARWSRTRPESSSRAPTPHPRSRGRCRSKGTPAASTSRGSGPAATCRAWASRPSPGGHPGSPAMRRRSPAGDGTCSQATSSPLTACRQMTTTDTDGHGLGIDRLDDFSPDVAYGHAGSQAGYSALLDGPPRAPGRHRRVHQRRDRGPVHRHEPA